MDLTPSPFRIKSNKQTLVFNFSNVGLEQVGYDDEEDGASDVLIGKKRSYF